MQAIEKMTIGPAIAASDGMYPKRMVMATIAERFTRTMFIPPTVYL